jgi:hypothetical protein
VGIRVVIISAIMLRIIHLKDIRNRSSCGGRVWIGVEPNLLYFSTGQ